MINTQKFVSFFAKILSLITHRKRRQQKKRSAQIASICSSRGRESLEFGGIFVEAESGRNFAQLQIVCDAWLECGAHVLMDWHTGKDEELLQQQRRARPDLAPVNLTADSEATLWPEFLRLEYVADGTESLRFSVRI